MSEQFPQALPTNSGKNGGIIAAIVFAALLIAGSLIFLGLQLKGGEISEKDFEANVAEAIDKYVVNQQADYQAKQKEANKPKIVQGDFTDDDAVLGDKDAPLVMVEFSDYECPYCANFYKETLPKIKEKYIDTGKVKLIYRDYPLSFHPNAFPAALFAECVRDQEGDEAYFKVHDKIFETIAGGFNYEEMSKFAVDLGAKEAELKKCFDEQKFKDEINADLADGERAGVSGTPGFIVGNRLVSGARPFADFEEIIEGLLAEGK